MYILGMNIGSCMYVCMPNIADIGGDGHQKDEQGKFTKYSWYSLLAVLSPFLCLSPIAFFKT